MRWANIVEYHIAYHCVITVIGLSVILNHQSSQKSRKQGCDDEQFIDYRKKSVHKSKTVFLLVSTFM